MNGEQLPLLNGLTTVCQLSLCRLVRGLIGLISERIEVLTSPRIDTTIDPLDRDAATRRTRTITPGPPRSERREAPECRFKRMPPQSF